MGLLVLDLLMDMNYGLDPFQTYLKETKIELSFKLSFGGLTVVLGVWLHELTEPHRLKFIRIIGEIICKWLM